MLLCEFSMLNQAQQHRLAAIEQLCHVTPWSLGMLMRSDELAYWSRACVSSPLMPTDIHQYEPIVQAYIVCMPLATEWELLNLTVAPEYQGQGMGSALLHAAILSAASVEVETIFLEVRASNAPAISVYQKAGFQTVGVRKHYYATHTVQREHALVMQLVLKDFMRNS
jgi:[ribosomal protein S18]-alanine N-acetyltransferase